HVTGVQTCALPISGAIALRAGGEGDCPVDEGTDVGLHRLAVLREERLLDARDQPLEGNVDAFGLDLRRLLVEEVVQLLLREVLDRLVRVEEAGIAIDPPVPAVGAVAGNREWPLAERLVLVVERGQVEVADLAHSLAARAHTAGNTEVPPLADGLPVLLERDGPGAADGSDIERKRL